MLNLKSKKSLLIAILVLIALLMTGYIMLRKYLINPLSPPRNSIDIELTELPADPSVAETGPYEIRVLNLSESSFTVFFKTKSPAAAFMRVGKDRRLKWKIADSRDIDPKEKSKKYYNHIFTFSDSAAVPESSYEYLFEIDGKVHDNAKKLYTVKLAPLLSSPPSVRYLDIYSSIASASSYGDTVAIISAYDEENIVESGYSGSLLDSESSILSLGSLRTIDGSKYSALKKLKIEVFDADKRYSNDELLDFDFDSVYNLILR
jgi:hypothetical protein